MTKEEKKTYKQQYDLTHKEEARQYRITNKEKMRLFQRQYAIDNKYELNQYQKKYRDNHKNETREYDKQYRLNHKTKRNTYHTNRIKSDINYKIACNLRSRVWQSLKGNHKAGSSVKDLGCSIDDFKKYITDKFQDGMTWGNYGTWHMDHILPLSKFNLENRQQFLTACHYTNYQPLWAIDNCSKNDTSIIGDLLKHGFITISNFSKNPNLNLDNLLGRTIFTL